MDILNEAAAETERLLKAATPGPWVADPGGWGVVAKDTMIAGNGDSGVFMEDADEVIIAHARNNIGPCMEALVEAVAALEIIAGPGEWCDDTGSDELAERTLASIKAKLEGVRDGA